MAILFLERSKFPSPNMREDLSLENVFEATFRSKASLIHAVNVHQAEVRTICRVSQGVGSVAFC